MDMTRGDNDDSSSSSSSNSSGGGGKWASSFFGRRRECKEALPVVSFGWNREGGGEQEEEEEEGVVVVEVLEMVVGRLKEDLFVELQGMVGGAIYNIV